MEQIKGCRRLVWGRGGDRGEGMGRLCGGCGPGAGGPGAKAAAAAGPALGEGGAVRCRD